jgi:hypothetical protein
MTITFHPVDADTSTLLPKYTAQQFRQGQSALYGGGSGRRLGGRSGFRVDTPSNILTATSTTWTLVPCAGMIDPAAATYQGMYGWATDSNITGTGPTGVVAADATNPRKDIVYIQIDDKNVDGSGSLAGDVKYLAGTPGVTPVAPTLPARSFLVGTITVPQSGGGSPTVVLNPARFAAAGAPLPVYSQTERDALDEYDGLIVQRRDLPGRPNETWDGAGWRGKGHAEFTGPYQASTAGAGINYGTLTVDAAKTVGHTFATGGAGGTVTASEEGAYVVTSILLPDASPGNVHMWATLAGDTVASEGQITYGGNIHTISFSVYLAAGATLTLGTTTSNTVNIGSRVKITKTA